MGGPHALVLLVNPLLSPGWKAIFHLRLITYLLVYNVLFINSYTGLLLASHCSLEFNIYRMADYIPRGNNTFFYSLVSWLISILWVIFFAFSFSLVSFSVYFITKQNRKITNLIYYPYSYYRFTLNVNQLDISNVEENKHVFCHIYIDITFQSGRGLRTSVFGQLIDWRYTATLQHFALTLYTHTSHLLPVRGVNKRVWITGHCAALHMSGRRRQGGCLLVFARVSMLDYLCVCSNRRRHRGAHTYPDT